MSDSESRKRPNQWFPDGMSWGPAEEYSINAAGALTVGAIIGTTGAFSGAVSGTTGTFTGAVSGTTITGTGALQGTNLVLTTGLITRSGTPQTLTGAGAVNITSAITWIVTTGIDALTLADGAEGQDKFIVMKTDGGAGTLTPSNLANGTTITFDDVGDSAHLLFTNGAWHFMGGTATLA